MGKPGVQVELAAAPGAVRQARAVVDRVAAGMPGDVGFRARVAVSELVANSVEHAAGTASDRVGLSVFRPGPVIRVEVRDRGGRFDGAPRAVPGRATSGRGLRLVDALVDRWGVEHEDGNLVWFEIDEPSGGEHDLRSTLSAEAAVDRTERASSMAWTEGGCARCGSARASGRVHPRRLVPGNGRARRIGAPGRAVERASISGAGECVLRPLCGFTPSWRRIQRRRRWGPEAEAGDGRASVPCPVLSSRLLSLDPQLGVIVPKSPWDSSSGPAVKKSVSGEPFEAELPNSSAQSPSIASFLPSASRSVPRCSNTPPVSS